ncbi:rho GTPase-activating protein 26-like isoform X2 [Oppia nitens]|nr:rho GTPase-activating protein 26-like isoform X2 [Oppia nitens]
MEQRHFFQASSEYVLKLQEVNERKKFEFVETVLSFMYGWLTFYHQGHEVAKEFKSLLNDLQIRLQRTRANYETTQNETESLMNKMLEVRKNKLQDSGSLNKMYTRQGYLFLMEKKAFGTSWAKHFCQYDKENKRFTMIQYNQTIAKIISTEEITLKECIRRMSDSIDKRFCFDIIPVEKPNVLYTFQALSEEDRKLWLDAMDGKEPTQLNPSLTSKGLPQRTEDCLLDDLGFSFVQKCIQVIEKRGLEDQGLYRVVGVASKVNKLIQLSLDRRKISDNNEIYDFDTDEWETKTITSALKTYFRNLPEPVMSFRLHTAFIAAAKYENKVQRIEAIHCLVHKLPSVNYEMLELLIKHLCKVANQCEKNLMTVSNLGVCFGPTLLRPEEETVAAIMDIKFGNVVVELLIDNCDKIFGSKPENGFPTQQRSSPLGAITPMNSSPYVPQMGANNPNNSPIYGRIPLQYDNNSTYAQIRGPTRSTSQDQLAGITNPTGQHQYRRPLYQHSLSHTNSHQMTASYPPPPSTLTYAQSIQSLPQQHYVQYPNGPQQSLQRPVRPMVYNQWNGPPNVMLGACSASHHSQQQQQHQQQQQLHQIIDNHKEKSPTTSSSSADSLLNSLSQTPSTQVVQNSSPNNTSSNNSYSSSQKSFYNYRQQLMTTPSVQNIPINFRKVRTRYACVGENDSELSFEPNMIITNVRPSREPGWLEGCLNGKTGLIPENYVEYLD